MKREIRQKRRKKIRGAAIGSVAAVLCVGAIFAVQAKRNILNSTKPYAEKTTFKILEIVPSHEGHENEEIGYYVSEEGIPASGTGRANFMDVSKAKSLGGRSETVTDVDSDEYKEELQNLLNMRNYGLIKFEGVDQGTYNVDVSEHPVYSREANFIKNSASGYIPLDTQYLKGNYTANKRGTGAYFLKEDYELRDDGTIWHIIRTMVPAPTPTPTPTPTVSDNTVSGNTVSGNTVSGNTVSENTVEPEMIEEITYEQVSDGDETNKGLPEGVEIRYEEDGTRRYTGDLDFSFNDGGRYYGLSVAAYNVREKAEIGNDFHNGEWFKEYVLGDRNSSVKIQIDTVAASAVTKTMLTDGTSEKYDLVYVSGTYDAYQEAGTDLTEEVVRTLYNLATMPQYQALIMDYAILGPSSGSSPTNLEKLALMLWQDDQREYLGSFTGASDKFGLDADGYVTSLPSASSSTWVTLGASMNTLDGIGNGTFVCGSTYVYNHKRDYFIGSKSQVDALDFFANGDFATGYTDDTIARGFSFVKAYVQMNNINYIDERVPEEITPAMVIQYILAYDGTTPSLIKTELNILEIEPVRAFLFNMYCGSDEYDTCDPKIKANRDNFIQKYLGDSFKDNQGAVGFTSMTIEEFVGNIKDLNESYDMIYIGTNTTHQLLDEGQFASYGTRRYTTYNYYFTKSGARTKKFNISGQNVTAVDDNSGTISNFRDFRMDGNIYYNIGDYYDVGTTNNTKDSLLGIIEDGTTFSNTTQKSLARFSGRDLTIDKKNQLIDYLNTGYPVIVAGDMMRTLTTAGGIKKRTINPTARIDMTWNSASEDGWDHGRVDNSSELYELLDYAVNGKEETVDGVTKVVGGDIYNLISEADVDCGIVTKEMIAEYLNKPKLTLNLTNRPVEYSYTTRTAAGQQVVDKQSSLTPDPATGKYYLEYEFSITNAARLYEDSDTYGVHVYIDVNADGKFSESEELNDCIVTNAVTGDDIAYTTSINGRVYSLQTNVLYRLRREVPDGFAGILPWSIEVVMNSNASYRASRFGYTKVPRKVPAGSTAEASKIKINILQVTHPSNSNLNLQSQLASPSGTNYFGIYLKNLDDYDVKVKTITQTQFESSYQSNPYFMDEYDMLILGFGDGYPSFNKSASVHGIVDYMNSGKPVLLTHDLLMFRSIDVQTPLLRNIVGMDRYGCVDDNHMSLRKTLSYTRSGDREIVEDIENAGYRVIYMPGTKREATDYQTQGLTNLTMVRFSYGSGSTNYNWRDYGNDYINWNDINKMARQNWNDQQSYKVHSINEGQITRYPYILPDSFTVAKTHNQYYQLDL